MGTNIFLKIHVRYRFHITFSIFSFQNKEVSNLVKKIKRFPLRSIMKIIGSQWRNWFKTWGVAFSSFWAPKLA